jgi:hypothetical protein
VKENVTKYYRQKDSRHFIFARLALKHLGFSRPDSVDESTSYFEEFSN